MLVLGGKFTLFSDGLFAGESLKGQISSREEFGQLTENLGLAMDYPFYAVAIFLYDGVIARSAGLNGIKRYEEKGIIIFGVQLFDDQTAFIVNLAAEEADSRLMLGFLTKTKSDLQIKHETLISAGVGNVYSNLLEISKSYIEASSAQDYRLLKGKGEIIFFSDLDAIETEKPWYPKDELAQLEMCFRQGNVDQIGVILDMITSAIVREKIPFFLAKCYCFDIINVILKITYELNIKIGVSLEDRPDLMELNDFETLTQLRESVHRISMDICDQIRIKTESKNYQLKEDMLEYIKENYRNKNFSREILADNFKKSPEYLSRYFKNQTSLTITEYVTTLRMKDVRMNLQLTQKSIKEIVDEAGYVNIASFNRKFKEIEGMSPGKFRLLMQQK